MNKWSGSDFNNWFSRFRKKSFQYSESYISRKIENAKRNTEKYKLIKES